MGNNTNTRLVGADKLKILEGEAKPFGKYGAHITVPSSWKYKKLRVQLLEE